MTPAPILCALALLAGPTEPPASKGAFWLNSGGVLLTAFGRGNPLVVPLGVTVTLPEIPALTFEATYFRWACTSTCNVSAEQGAFITAGFHFDTEGKGPLSGFFVSPKLQLSGFHRTFLPSPNLDGFTFGAELGLDLGYQWRLGNFYLALMFGASGGAAINHPSGLYGLLVESNGSTAPLIPQPITWVFGINANVLRLGFVFF